MSVLRHLPLLFLSLVLLLFALSSSCSATCDYSYPLNYVAYHLTNDTPIKIDGILDELAWEQAGWSEDFIDIQGPQFPTPRFETKIKMRWDEDFLYVGAYLQDDNIWANMTQHDSVIYNDNDFEVFVDPDGSNAWYKELEINAINTFWDLILNKPYSDGGTANWQTFDMPTLKSAVYADCTVNDPASNCSYWTVELALPFVSYVINDTVATNPPKDKDQWRINFSRVEWRVQVVNGTYEKTPNDQDDNWVWTSQHAINMHLPEHWGFVQFSNQTVNSTSWVPDPNWPIRDALMQMYYAEKKFSVMTVYFTDNMTQLVEYGNLPEYVYIGACTNIPVIVTPSAEAFSFSINITSEEDPTLIGHIRDDRYIWFG